MRAVRAAGLAALLVLALVEPRVAVLGALGLLLGPALGSRLAPASAPLSALVLAGLALGALAGGLAPHSAVAGAIVWVLALSSARKEPRAARLALLAGAIAVAHAATRTSGLAFLPAFALWAALLPAALAATSKGAASIGWSLRVAPAVIALAAALFWLLPRPGGASLSLEGGTVTGIGDTVALGEMGPMLVDTTPVLRVRMEPVGGVTLPEALYVRAAVLDRFDGRAWRATPPLVPLEPAPLARGIRAQMLQSERPDGALFALGEVRGVHGVEARTDASGNLRSEGLDGLTWTLLAAPPFAPGQRREATLAEEERRRALQLPAVHGDVRAIAASLDGESPEALAAAARAWLVANMRYSREPRDGQAEDPLATFLLEGHIGHCEYFASAAAVLLRLRGVPTRLVHGFVSRERNEAGGYRVIRASHAHAWIEFHDGVGWTAIDPTPGPGVLPEVEASPALDALAVWWAEHVVGFDGGQQRAAVGAIGAAVGGATGVEGSAAVPVGWALLLALLAAVGVGLRPLLARLLARLAGEASRRRPGRVEQAWLAARRAAVRRTGDPPAALPPLSAAEWLAQVDPAGEELVALAWLHYRVVYGGEADEALAAEADALCRRARAARAG